jgi:hypothetical protein
MRVHIHDARSVLYVGARSVASKAFPVTIALPGAITPVIWMADFRSNTTGLQVQWQWSSAVYTSLRTDCNALGVKPVDCPNQSRYRNSDDAGTLENFKSVVTAVRCGSSLTGWAPSAMIGVQLAQSRNRAERLSSQL